ncbi:glycoside hydrolase family 97 catalytic domain-containing protein, partial [candidate division KSB1 bacterium]|nr:glycoside hydrolase family 97 catalytic domain-containing protein [candidate division KSB1 bacterium]
EMNHGGDIQDLIAYADSKGVGLILWYNSGGPHNQVPDACPCDIMDDPVKRRAEMQKLQEWGVKGIKVDFMQSDKQYVIQLYHDILLDAADYHLLVDFHGATIPRGWQRTFPNLMTMEGIRGAEQYWDVNFAENAHTFHTIYTFTRNVVGSMDYTPVIFGDAENKIPHQTTNAHELATAVAFESGLQHFADNAQNYLAQPDYVLDFLSTVPVAWDETQYIEGIPGKWIVMARRKKQDWYIVGLNGGLESRTISIPLPFLQENDYICLLITDGKQPREFTGDRLTVSKDDTLSLIMTGRGGFSARYSPN